MSWMMAVRIAKVFDSFLKIIIIDRAKSRTMTCFDITWNFLLLPFVFAKSGECLMTIATPNFVQNTPLTLLHSCFPHLSVFCFMLDMLSLEACLPSLLRVETLKPANTAASLRTNWQKLTKKKGRFKAAQWLMNPCTVSLSFPSLKKSLEPLALEWFPALHFKTGRQ